MLGGGGNGWWSPTQNRRAMQAFADRVQQRRPERREHGWRRRAAELFGVVIVTLAVFYGLSALF